MIKAKEIFLTNIALLLAFSVVLSAGYFITRPHPVARTSAPVFIGEEVVVHKAVKALTITKAVSLPQPAPQIAVPLPIIPPAVTYKVLPAYPLAALDKGLTGSVILSVYIGLGGQPEKIETKVSSGVAELDAAAAQAVSQWKFSPALQGGAALASWFEIPVRFEVK